MSIKIQQQQKLSQRLSPQQILLMRLIQSPILELEERIKQELEDNPALDSDGENTSEEDDFLQDDDFHQDDTEHIATDDINIDEYLSDDEIPEYRLQTNNYSEEPERNMPFHNEISFMQSVLEQLGQFSLSKTERIIAEFLIGNLDSNGYSSQPVEEVVDELAFRENIYTSVQEVEQILRNIIFQLDPAGLGARSLQECLLIQLKRRTPSEQTLIAIEILEKHFETFAKKHYEKIIQRCGISQEMFKKVITEIAHLNPKPGGAYSQGTNYTEQITPDFTINVIDGELELILNNKGIPELHISKQYTQMLENYKNAKNKQSMQETVSYIKDKLDSAKWFIDAIRQRQNTMNLTMNAIMHHQKEYLLTGDDLKLKPLILKDIAEEVGMDISTISRVVNDKYVSTPYGTKPIKVFFSESVKNEKGEDIATRKIKAILSDIISHENKSKPYPDEILVELLKEKGYPIARRTIAKYRDQLNIPESRLRREL